MGTEDVTGLVALMRDTWWGMFQVQQRAPCGCERPEAGCWAGGTVRHMITHSRICTPSRQSLFRLGADDNAVARACTTALTYFPRTPLGQLAALSNLTRTLDLVCAYAKHWQAQLRCMAAWPPSPLHPTPCPPDGGRARLSGAPSSPHGTGWCVMHRSRRLGAALLPQAAAPRRQ